MQKGSRKRQASQISEYSRNVHGFLKVKIQIVEKKQKAGPRHDFSPYKQQNLMAKTPQFKEDAAHRPEVRFYPINSLVSGGEKRRN